MYYVLIIGVWFATFAMLVQTGLWSNLITLAQIVLAGLIAFGVYQPLTVLLEEQTDGSYTYLLDFIMIWATYGLAMLVFKVLDGALSKKHVRFLPQVDAIGGPVVGFAAGGVMASIVLASMHAAPLAPDMLGGNLSHSKGDLNTASSFSAPDLAWLRLVEASLDSGLLGSGANPQWSDDFVQNYVALYASRREKFAEVDDFRVKRSN